jgi:hypothetical protein
VSVVVTPDAVTPAASALDIVAVATDPAACVTTWRDSDADAVLVDSADDAILTTIREEPGGDEVPVVFVTPADYTEAPADAVITPNADAATVSAAVERARTARDYRLAVTALYAACQGRDIGQPEADIRDLREAADRAYENLDGIPPSVFYAGPEKERWG